MATAPPEWTLEPSGTPFAFRGESTIECDGSNLYVELDALSHEGGRFITTDLPAPLVLELLRRAGALPR